MSSDAGSANADALARLIATMAALRTPGSGCPWDLEQTFATIAPYTIEEACEVADAIARGDMVDLCDELGDLLLQVVFHARMAEEQGLFAFADVARAITEKLVRRHPHVFAGATAASGADVKVLWERIKAEERAAKARAKGLDPDRPAAARTLDGVPAALPALARAVKLQDKAAAVGFDWPGLAPVLDKVREELGELEREIEGEPRAAPGSDAHQRAEDELGDLLFVLANVARHLKIDPEAALRRTNEKFRRRFAGIEDRLAHEGRSPAQSSLAEMDRLWTAVKAAERAT